MSLSDLKLRLHDLPGIESLTMQEIAGRLNFGLNGKIVSLDPNATEGEIEETIRNAVASPSIAQIPIPPSSASLIPNVAVAPRQAQGGPMSVTGAGHAGLSLKQMLSDRKAKIAAAHDKVAANFAKLDEATTALDTMGDKIGAEAADLLQAVAQFTNDLSGDAT